MSEQIAELESGLFVACLALAALQTRLDTFDRENAHLRVVAQQVSCPYGMRASNGACTLGYPGCACMDDAMALVSFYPEGKELKALDRMRAQNRVLQDRLDCALDRLQAGARYFRTVGDGFKAAREPSKAAAMDNLAAIMEAPI